MIHDYDQDWEDGVVTQPRCRCGALLSWRPTESGVFEKQHPLYHIEYKAIPGTEIVLDDGFTIGPDFDEEYVVDGVEIERIYTELWTCKRCGAQLEADEVYR